jgi:undecaprenyl phosphate-alpha-L-ara4N flippase subunit ArnF
VIRTPHQYNGVLLIISSILLGSAAQLLLKIGINLLPAELSLSIPFPVTAALWIVSGLACYGLSLMLWMMALSRYELSFAYPMLSLSYILVYLGAMAIPQLHETFSVSKTLGILLIVLGVILVTRSKKTAVDTA